LFIEIAADTFLDVLGFPDVDELIFFTVKPIDSRGVW
jgi:hypothetical protein